MCATFCTWICEEYVYCRAFMLKVCLCKRVYFILFEKKKLLCSVIVHICNIYVNRKENIGIMKPVKVMLCHLTATICSSPKGLMFKSLMKKKIVSHINVKLFLQRDENRKSLPCTRKCNVMENLTNVNVFMRLWTDMVFLGVSPCVVHVYKQMHVVCEGFYILDSPK